MKINTNIKIDDLDVNGLLNTLGMAWRDTAGESEVYDSLVESVKRSAEELAQRAFETGRNFEAKHSV